MLHEMETKAFPVDGVGSNERNKNNRKTLFKCPFIKSIISSYFFSVEAEAKMINFLQKVFLFCCFFLKAQRYKRQMKRPRSELTSKRKSSQAL